MRALRHIAALGLTAAALAGCAATSEMEGYVGHSISEAILDHGSPTEVFQLTDRRRAYQWEITKEGFRPAPRPTIGVGIGIGGGHWGGGITTVNTSYVPYSKTCRYTLIADARGNDWVVGGYRRPAQGCA